jgi:RNA polymerase sigma-70 factor, ECF subfamily
MLNQIKGFTTFSKIHVSSPELIGRAKRLDPQALTEIYDIFSPGIYRYALRLLGDQNLACECLSDTFQRFLIALQHGAGPDDYIRAYLYRIAHNWVSDHYRNKSSLEVELDEETQCDLSQDPAHIIVQEFDRQQVRNALALLTPDQRQVIALKFIEDWTNEEISQSLNKPVGSIKSLQHRALRSLRRLILQDKENSE